MHGSFLHKETLVVRNLALEVFFCFILLSLHTKDRIIPRKVSLKAFKLILKSLVFTKEIVFEAVHELVLSPNLVQLRSHWVIDFFTLLSDNQCSLIWDMIGLRAFPFGSNNLLVISHAFCHYFYLRFPLLRFSLNQLNIVQQILPVVFIIEF